MALVKFTGGPLNGQKLRMDIYTHVVPVMHMGFNEETKEYNAYYKNVNQPLVGSDMTNQFATHYVYHEHGHMKAAVDKHGNYVP